MKASKSTNLSHSRQSSFVETLQAVLASGSHSQVISLNPAGTLLHIKSVHTFCRTALLAFGDYPMKWFTNELKLHGFRKRNKREEDSPDELYYFHRCFQDKQYACIPFRIQFGEITRKNPKERAVRREDEIENYRDAITDSVFVLQQMLLRASKHFPDADELVYSLRHTQQILGIVWIGKPFYPPVDEYRNDKGSEESDIIKFEDGSFGNSNDIPNAHQ